MAIPFYIIGHNPNFVKDAIKCLRDGANAIEPDIQYDEEVDGHFYVSEFAEHDPTQRDRKPTLINYLESLKVELGKANAPEPPALIAFDVKHPYVYDLNELYTIIRKHFSKDYPKVAILTTIGDPNGMDFLAKVEGRQHINEAIGVDENASPGQVVQRFQSRSLSYTYANGSTPFNPSQFLHFIIDAIPLRDDPKNGLDLVYSWTAKKDRPMKDFLDREINGLITDDVSGLYKLLTTDEKYKQKYEIVKMGFNPFHRNTLLT